MNLRAALSRFLSLLPGKGRPSSPPPPDKKMRRGYEDKMRRGESDKVAIHSHRHRHVNVEGDSVHAHRHEHGGWQRDPQTNHHLSPQTPLYHGMPPYDRTHPDNDPDGVVYREFGLHLPWRRP